MSRTFPIPRPFRLSSLLTAVVAAACLAVFGGPAARAGAYTYGTTPQRTVNAGILLVDGNQTPNPPANNTWATAALPDNKDPYVFYILSQRNDILPFGWTIVNPLAPGAVTSQIKLRWDTRTGSAASPSYQLGQSLSPAMAAYWEVPLTQTTRDDLAKFDVLLLNVENSFDLSAGDVEKLRRFVEGGGTLWIEDSHSPVGTGGGITLGTNGAFTSFLDLQFQGSTSGGTTTNYAALPTFTRAPLITTPYNLSENELNILGENHVGNYSSVAGAGGAPIVFSPLSVIVNNGDPATTRPLVAAGQYGAGQVVVTCTGSVNAINDYAGGVDVYQVTNSPHPNSGPYCGTAYQLAPTQDLKLTTDILASADGHPNEHQNSHQSGASLSGLPAVAKSWSDTVNTGGQTGATVYGHLAYVTKGGTLYAYDLYPSEDLDGNGDPDDGKATNPDYDTGTPYDVVWSKNVGANASAPTVAVAKAPSQTVAGPIVFVEADNGKIAEFDASNGNSLGTLGSGATAYSSLTPSIPAPAPTFFDDRVFAALADGTLFVGTVSTGVGAAIPVNPNVATDTAKAITASPTVGIIPSSRGDNDIVALCTTGNGLYSVFLGSRGERLTRAASGYNTKLAVPLKAAMNTVTSLPYTVSQANVTTNQKGVAENASGNPSFASPAAAYATDPFFANYDADIAQSITNGNMATPATVAPLTRTMVGGAPAGGGTAAQTNNLLDAAVSAPALDRFGNVYYTVTDTRTGHSTLFSVHDAPNSTDIRVNWRFLLPTSAGDPGLDADGATYTGLIGYQFVTGPTTAPVASAPVVDDQGNVFVLATNPANKTTAVLCFNGTGAVSTDIGDPSAQQTGVTITQTLGTGVDEFGSATPATLTPNQYSVGAGGRITFSNFATETNIGGAGTHAMYPNLNEPYPVTVAYNGAAAQNQQAQSGVIRPLHTNLTWYTLLDGGTPFPTGTYQQRKSILATSGLTKAGTGLYFVDSAGYLDSITANPQTITKKFVESGDPISATPVTTAPVFAQIAATETGTTTAVPSASNGVLLINGALGTAAFTNQITLVVDNNRVLEMDSNGDAQWAVDSTSKTTLAGDTTPIYSYDPTTSKLGTGQFVTTTLELNRPTSITELTQNDYLVADTGNNRCVRFDRAGKVIWELTKFNDATAGTFKPNNLLKPGEPDTLNQPTGVQIRTETASVPVFDAMGTQTTVTGTIVHYLISDTGNYRVLEIDDVYDNNLQFIKDKNGNVIGNHLLKWTSHTHDLQGREYRYQSASYYASPISGKFYVVALITNKRLAPFTYTLGPTQTYGQAALSFLAPANQDAPGGTIVLLDYDPANAYGTAGFGTNNQADGFIGTDPNKGLIAISTIKTYLTNAGGFSATGTGTPTTLYIRNPRYMKVLTKMQAAPGGGTASVRHYLLADDNGVWDLDGINFMATFGFTQADYRNMMVPTLSGATTYTRTALPFLPGSLQLLGTDIVGGNSVGRYLITNTFSQGEAANDVNKVGGEVFEVDLGQALTGGYNSHTLSRPTNTSPLSQPAFAYRLQ